MSEDKEALVNNRKWVSSRACVRMVFVVFALLAVLGCRKEEAEEQSTPGPVVEDVTTTGVSGLVGNWQMKMRGTNLVIKSTLSLTKEGTYTYMGQRGETIDTGTYKVDGENLILEGSSCTGPQGEKLSPCVGVYKVTITWQGETATGMMLLIVDDPSLSRRVDFGGQEFVPAK
jgi:hypothetical protein